MNNNDIAALCWAIGVPVVLVLAAWASRHKRLSAALSAVADIAFVVIIGSGLLAMSVWGWMHLLGR